MKNCFKFGGIVQFWHCILVLTLQIFVLTRSVRKYISLRTQIFDARHGLDWDATPLHFYINCIVLAAALTLLMAFLLCANSEYHTIGSVSLNSPELFSNSIAMDDLSNRTNSLSPVKKKRSFAAQKNRSENFPLAYLCHVLAAYFLLLPISWVLGEQAKNEAVDPNLVWQTDLSYIFPVLSPKDMMKNARIRHPDLVTKLASTGLYPTRLKGTDLLAVQPPTLGGIGQLPQTKRQEIAVDDLKLAIIRHSSGIKMTYSENAPGFSDTTLRPPSPELINYFLSLAFIAIRIGITFWQVWPTFSYLTSILLIFTCIYLTVEYAAVSLLIQLTVCLTINSSSNNTYGTLVMVRLPMRLTSWQMILLISIGYIVTLSSYGILFHLGIRQFHRAIQKNYYTVANVLRITKENSNGVSEMLRPSTPCSEMPSADGKESCLKCHCWQLYDHFLVFFGFLSLVANVLVRIPCFCDIFLLYWNEKDYLCLTAVILFICIHLAWLMMWFAFATKQKWNFHMPYPRAIPQCMDPSIQSQFLTEPTVQGNLTYTPIAECDGEASLALRNNAVYTPLQLQNPGMSFQSPLYLSSTQLNSTSINPKYPLTAPFLPETSTGHVVTNKFYKTCQLNNSGGNETFPVTSPYFLEPTGQKCASAKVLNQFDTEPSGGKQDVLINVVTAPLSPALCGPRTPSCETARSDDTRPQSVTIQSIDGGGGSVVLRVTPIAVQESGQCEAGFRDQICSRV